MVGKCCLLLLSLFPSYSGFVKMAFFFSGGGFWRDVRLNYATHGGGVRFTPMRITEACLLLSGISQYSDTKYGRHRTESGIIGVVPCFI